MLKAGILGYGGVGSGMARILKERGMAEVVGACDISEEALAAARARGLKATKDARELCSWDVDFVCVTSTNSAHYEHVMAAARAGRHVLCEKPPALTLGQLDEMIEATEQRKLTTAVNYIRRLEPPHVKMKQMADSGELGRLMSVTCFVARGWGLAMHGRPHPAVAHPEISGGWLVHHACHQVDYLCWLLGPAKTAYCRSSSTARGADSPEVVWGILQHENGAMGVVGDTVGAFRQGLVSIIGTKATVQYMRTPTGDVMTTRRETGTEFPYTEDVLGFGISRHHEGTLQAFTECLREGRPYPHDLRSTRTSFIAIQALEESRRTGQIVRL